MCFRLSTLVEKMWKFDPKERPNFRTIIQLLNAIELEPDTAVDLEPAYQGAVVESKGALEEEPVFAQDMIPDGQQRMCSIYAISEQSD